MNDAGYLIESPVSRASVSKLKKNAAEPPYGALPLGALAVLLALQHWTASAQEPTPPPQNPPPQGGEIPRQEEAKPPDEPVSPETVGTCFTRRPLSVNFMVRFLLPTQARSACKITPSVMFP